MKIVISKKVLLDVLTDAERCVSKTELLPITGSILVETVKDGITVTSTDTEKGIKVKCECKVEEEGKVCIPFRKLMGVVKELSATQDITISINKERASIKCGASKFSMSILPAEDFPKIEFGCTDGVCIKIKGSDLKRIGQLIGLTASNDMGSSTMQGICVIVQGGKLFAYSTDRKRLSELTCKVVGDEFKNKIIVPVEAFTSIGGAIEKEEDDVNMVTNYNSVFFKTKNKTISSRLMAGEYPEIGKKIPKNSHKISFKQQELSSAVKQIMPFVSENVFGITITIKKDKAVVSIKGEGGEDAEVSVEAKQTGGDEFHFSMNFDYISQFLRVCKGDNVVFEVSDEKGGIVCKCEGEEGYQSVLMPMVI